jgi:hypothetical protein
MQLSTRGERPPHSVAPAGANESTDTSGNQPHRVDVTRRSLIRVGAVGASAAALVGTMSRSSAAGAATASDATPYVTPEQFGAVGDGITDDTAAINAALAAAKLVHLAATTYRIDGLVVRPSGVNIVGAGGTAKGVDLAATVLKCTSAGAGLQVLGGGGMVQGLTVDGGLVATNCILVGGTTTAEWGAYPSFIDVTAKYAAGDNWRLYGSQNGSMVHCNSIGGTRGIVMDYGIGGWLFNRVEVDSPSGVGLQMTNTPGGSLFPNTFIQCIFERRSTDGPTVLISTANNQVFYHCTFSSQLVSSPTMPIVSVTSNGLCEFHSPFVSVQAGQSGIAVKGAATGTWPQVRITGGPAMSGYGNGPAYFLDVDANGVATLEGWIHNSLGNGAYYKSPTSPDANVLQLQQTSRTVIRPAAGDLVERAIVRGEAAPRHWRDTQGTLSWGPGNSQAADLTLGRSAAGLMAVQGGLALSKDITAGRHLNTLQTIALSANGVATIDASLGDVCQVNLNGFTLTGLAINNGANTQRLTVVLTQGQTVSTAMLPGAAAGFLWKGGDNNRPVAASAAQQSVVFTLMCVNGSWLETSRVSADLPWDQALQKDFSTPGKLAILKGGLRWYNDTGRTVTLRRVRLSAGTAPVGNPVVIDVNRNGTSVFATTADQPRIASGTNTTLLAFAVPAVISPGDYLTIDVDAVGTTKPGNDLLVTLLMA